MQLFALSPSPIDAADVLTVLDRKRAQAQLKEGMQMVAAYEKYDPPLKINGEPYSRYWKKHPVTKWVIEDDNNFAWTVAFLSRISINFPNHGCTVSLEDWIAKNGVPKLSKMPTFKYFGSWEVEGRCVHEKYHQYLKDKQKKENT